jgi:hypothetical protein
MRRRKCSKCGSINEVIIIGRIPKFLCDECDPKKSKHRCQACGADNAHPTDGWYRLGTVHLCRRCEDESKSKTSEYEVRLDWSDDGMTCYVVRKKRHAACIV